MKKENFENTTCHYERNEVMTKGEMSITSPQPSPRGEGEVVGEHNANHTNSGEVKKAAFTLAETLITLSILGIVAAITIPALIGRQVDSQNRSKLRKAMAAYEKAVNQILIDNDLQTEDSFKNWADNDATTKNYAGQRGYFKIAEESTRYPNCRFKTGDGVWWDICGTNGSNIENPIIILDNAYKDTARTGDNGLEALAKTENDANGKKAYVYALVGHRDATTGSVRVNDKAYEDSVENNTANQQYLEKVYAFNEKRAMSTISSGTTTTPKTNTDKLADCATSSAASCKVTYGCPTQEEPTKTCELEMTKQTFNTTNCDTTSLNGPSDNSCPTKTENYVVIPELEYGKSWDEANCPDGTHKAKAGELAQLWNNGAEGNVLSTNCSSCRFWAQEDDPYESYDAAYFSTKYGTFGYDSKSYSYYDGFDDMRVVCVGD